MSFMPLIARRRRLGLVVGLAALVALSGYPVVHLLHDLKCPHRIGDERGGPEEQGAWAHLHFHLDGHAVMAPSCPADPGWRAVSRCEESSPAPVWLPAVPRLARAPPVCA